MARKGSHWSEPAARRTLAALVRLGGHATTLQLAQTTLSVAVHNDIHNLRCWLQHRHGYPETDTHDAVRTVYEGKNANGRQIVRYRLRADVIRLWRRLEYERTHGPQRQTALI